MRTRLAALVCVLAACGRPAVPGAPTPTTDGPPPVTAPGPSGPVAALSRVTDDEVTFTGQSNTCIHISQLQPEWTFEVPPNRARAIRFKAVSLYSPFAKCGNIKPTTDGGVGELHDMTPVNRVTDFPPGMSGTVRYQLDANQRCGAIEYESWDLETGQSLPHLNVIADRDCPPKIEVKPEPKPEPKPPVVCPVNPRDIWAKQPVRGQFGQFAGDRWYADLTGYLKPEYVNAPIVLSSWEKEIPGQLIPQTRRGLTQKSPTYPDISVNVVSCSAQIDILVWCSDQPVPARFTDAATFAAVDRTVAFADWNRECRPGEVAR